jgi:hypothetical protein
MTTKLVMCSEKECGNEIKYGHIVVRGPSGILCEHCARKNGVRGEAVVYGGKAKPNSVQRDRAQRKLKRLGRMMKRDQRVLKDVTQTLEDVKRAVEHEEETAQSLRVASRRAELFKKGADLLDRAGMLPTPAPKEPKT